MDGVLELIYTDDDDDKKAHKTSRCNRATTKKHNFYQAYHMQAGSLKLILSGSK